jgi:hypothetical protein
VLGDKKSLDSRLKQRDLSDRFVTGASVKLILPVVAEDFEHYLERWYRDGKSLCAYAPAIGLYRAEHHRKQEHVN